MLLKIPMFVFLVQVALARPLPGLISDLTPLN
jgi:hypothetical protein